MRSTFCARLAALSVFSVILLSGCTAETPPAATPPTPATDAPVFASDEEALAAATAAYAAYVSMSNLILSEGGVGPARIREVASESLAVVEIAGFDQAKTEGIRTNGAGAFDNVVLQRVDGQSLDGVGIVTVYLCSDVSRVEVTDSHGQSVVIGSRPDRTPFEVSFDLRTLEVPDLLVGGRSVWKAGGVC